MIEREMEDIISCYPEETLGEPGLQLLARQYSIGSYRFDLLFKDRHGGHLVVELQKGTLDRTHTYKILDYYHEYSEKNPSLFIDTMIVANVIPAERKRRLQDLGVDYREIPEATFLEFSAKFPQRHEGNDDRDSSNQEAPQILNDSDDYEVRRLKRAFIQQTEEVREVLRLGQEVSCFYIYRNLPDDGKNWFVWWIPANWGRGSSGAGVHWALSVPTRNRRPTNAMRLSVGVEKPILAEFKETFLRRLIERATKDGSIPGDFEFWSPGGKLRKLIALPSFPMFETGVNSAIQAYRRSHDFNQLVAEEIRLFEEQGAFEEGLRYK